MIRDFDFTSFRFMFVCNIILTSFVVNAYSEGTVGLSLYLFIIVSCTATTWLARKCIVAFRDEE